MVYFFFNMVMPLNAILVVMGRREEERIFDS